MVRARFLVLKIHSRDLAGFLQNSTASQSSSVKFVSSSEGLYIILVGSDGCSALQMRSIFVVVSTTLNSKPILHPLFGAAWAAKLRDETQRLFDSSPSIQQRLSPP